MVGISVEFDHFTIQIFGAVEQTSLKVVACQLRNCHVTLFARKVRSCQQILVDLDSAVDLTLGTKQVAERYVNFDRILIDFN